MRLAMAIDLDRCVGCKACVSACKEQWDSGPGAARCWVDTLESGTRGTALALSFYPGLCMQCEDHPCTAGCPTGATAVDPRTGVVTVDPDGCVGCASCVAACPYGARRYDPEKEIVEKCDLCAPFVARGEQPACVATCPADCRILGDLDDPSSAVAALRATGARPLVTARVNVRPKTVYAGDAHRERILAAGVVAAPRPSALARSFGAAAPVVRRAVPGFAAASVAGGLLVNLAARRQRVACEESPAGEERQLVPRHRAGIRALHWWNALSWIALAATGVGLLSSAGFSVAGVRFPRWLGGAAGGPAALLRLHVGWGLAWAGTIIPLFLVWKHGPRGVLEEVRLTGDDLRWLAAKPLALLGRSGRPLPPQDKYNAGQKLFAMLVLAATATIVATGLVMTFHFGPPRLVAAAVVAHGAAVALTLAGVAVHLTMAAVVAEERPALRSMLDGRIDARHAAHHSPKWIARISRQKEE